MDVVEVRLMEDRARQYGVRRIYGTATEEGPLFWPRLGYTLSNHHIEKVLSHAAA